MLNHRLADLSDTLFKTRYTLPVAATMLSFSDGRFTKHQVAEALDVNDNLVREATARFLKAGFLKEGVKDVEGQQLELVPGPFWRFVKAL
jgi:hypothetical protein